MYIYINAYAYIFICACNHENNVPSPRLSHSGFFATHAFGDTMYNVCHRSVMTICINIVNSKVSKLHQS